MKQWPIYVFSLAIIDQLVKLIALNWAQPGGLFTIAYNTGLTFGLLPGSNGFMIIISLVAITALGYAAHKTRGLERLLLSVVNAGVLGNLIDRALRGAVVDYISISNFPVFNLADVLIVGGVIGLIIIEYFQNSSNSSKSSK